MLRSLLFFILISTGVFAQEPGIIGASFSAGAMNYIGDLDDDSPIRFIKPAVSLQVTILPYDKFNVSFCYLHGSVWGDDSKAEQLGNKYRNLKFHSNVD